MLINKIMKNIINEDVNKTYKKYIKQTKYFKLMTEKISNSWGIASFVTGLIGLILSFVWVGGPILSILAIIFSRKQSKTHKTGLSTAGLVLGIINLIPFVIAILSLILIFVSKTMTYVAAYKGN